MTGFASHALLDPSIEEWTTLSYANYTYLENHSTFDIHLPAWTKITRDFNLTVRQIGPELRLLWRQQVSAADGNRTMALGIHLPFDPFSDRGTTWLADFRNAMSLAADDEACDCGRVLDAGAMQLAGGGSGEHANKRSRTTALDCARVDGRCSRAPHLSLTPCSRANSNVAGILDAIATVYDAFPLVITATFACAFAVILLAFRSLFVPLRAVLSIALTVGWVYGLLVWVYQEGGAKPSEHSNAALSEHTRTPAAHSVRVPVRMAGLEWTRIASLQPTPQGVSWIVPVITFAVLVGLGLDYDVFLLTRVYEIRLAGATNTRALTQGLVRSGNVITAAGLIMSIAFCGLLLNTQPALNQMAAVLVCSVLLDTFVVRTVLLPAIMSLLGRLNWWPRTMPPPNEPETPAPLGCSCTCYEVDTFDDVDD